MMFIWDEEWNISFAGCGFRCIYHMGVLSCILQHAPQLLHGASKICGASSGCLVAAALTTGIPIEDVCVHLLSTAKEVRKHTLRVFHPSFSLLRTVQDFLLEKLPDDAHLRASGKLCVSLTRVADGQNVLVSEFDSREDLIQQYVDGALSNNMPLSEQRNTITVAPFSGESDICPREGTFNFFEVHCGNVSIQVNTGNLHRMCTSFLPPAPEKLAEICHNGYMDALRFVTERDLVERQCFTSMLVTDMDLTRRLASGPYAQHHHWMDQRHTENLPISIKKVLCEACMDSHDGGARWCRLTEVLPVKLLLCVLTVFTLPLKLIFLLLKR
ncbi:patatin-like phospholipase domain-containing protein 2 isoform X2 [Thalassophryne amazonica]|uniref:patatin-like phospholipase domain-containing protein 2 isoform X2 n=1 Tax=Thalassophryne amazonica TaxID=390379 RepID=UPI001470ECAF|nr:patatin-like phospholipase domain-containing protein 2 isoform X2 [Thalassophryne amazonica]